DLGYGRDLLKVGNVGEKFPAHGFDGSGAAGDANFEIPFKRVHQNMIGHARAGHEPFPRHLFPGFLKPFGPCQRINGRCIQKGAITVKNQRIDVRKINHGRNPALSDCMIYTAGFMGPTSRSGHFALPPNRLPRLPKAPHAGSGH
ncbi:MAG: hypothetical protein ABF826_03360, partial [Komagataeibacter saccharivorans]